VTTAPRALAGFVGAALARPRFMGGLMSGFAATTFAIALVGIYGIVSCSVASRTREIGVRVALGASRSRVLGLVARHLIVTLGVGVPAGLAGAWMLARWMAVLLYDVQPWEPLTYATVAIGLTVAAGVATAAPVRRALRIDPVVALRADGAWQSVTAMLELLVRRGSARNQVWFARGRTIRIEVEGAPLPAQLDGDVLGTTPLDIRILPGALTVFVDPKTAPGASHG